MRIAVGQMVPTAIQLSYWSLYRITSMVDSQLVNNRPRNQFMRRSRLSIFRSIASNRAAVFFSELSNRAAVFALNCRIVR